MVVSPFPQHRSECSPRPCIVLRCVAPFSSLLLGFYASFHTHTHTLSLYSLRTTSSRSRELSRLAVPQNNTLPIQPEHSSHLFTLLSFYRRSSQEHRSCTLQRITSFQPLPPISHLVVWVGILPLHQTRSGLLPKQFQIADKDLLRLFNV